MRKREIKKTQISYQAGIVDQAEVPLERSRQKKQKLEVVDVSSRRARLAMLKNRMNQQEQIRSNQQQQFQPTVNISANLNNLDNQAQSKPKESHLTQSEPRIESQQPIKREMTDSEKEEEDEENSNQAKRVLLKPVYIPKQDREQEQAKVKEKEEQRKKKALRYTTKLLLLENAKEKNQSDEEILHSSDEEIETNLPDDDDNKNEEYEYELWKIRELKRIRRDKEERRKIQVEKAEIQRRRKLNNEEILLENKVMGSDATDNQTETKYVYMQKYYHKGAFYQDSQDPIFKRDYNLPTPLQMQDKSMLPQILQKRQGNFGKKGQSKYKHLTAEDTTNFDPQFRPDEGILASWKKKMAGYKGSRGSNI